MDFPCRQHALCALSGLGASPQDKKANEFVRWVSSLSSLMRSACDRGQQVKLLTRQFVRDARGAQLLNFKLLSL